MSRLVLPQVAGLARRGYSAGNMGFESTIRYDLYIFKLTLLLMGGANFLVGPQRTGVPPDHPGSPVPAHAGHGTRLEPWCST